MSAHTSPQQVSRACSALAALACGIALLTAATARAVDADPMPVPTFRAQYSDTDEVQRRFPALIEARRSSALGFDSGGRIAAIHVDTGDRVEAGALLARLDTRALEAELAAARAQAMAAQARAKIATTTLQRETQLVEQGHVSAQRLEELSAAAQAEDAVTAAAKAQAAALAVRIELARIEAPFTGVISARSADEGTIVAAGTPVLQIVEDGSLELRASLPWRDAQKLREGATYTAEVAGQRLPVRFRAATDVVDARRRSVSVVFDLAPGSGVRSGETAQLFLPTDIEVRGFWAPVTALTEGRRGVWNIYALVPGEQADVLVLEPRPVSVEYLEEDRVFLSGAVAEGTVLLAAGVHRVVPGQRVRPAAGAEP
jgi:RND family efflux transporter MFP subunit